MPRIPPRPLCLPELLLDPRTKADYIQANPPRHGPNSRPPSAFEEYSLPPSPSSAHGPEFHRQSRATSPPPPSTASLTSNYTNLSLHRADSTRTSVFSLSSDKEKRSSKTWSIGDIAFGDAIVKPRATWSNTFKTKSWFGSVAAANEAKQAKPHVQSEIKLSPSMVAAVAETEAMRPLRPLSSPYPTGNTTSSPRIGVGLQYYTEKNPAPPDIRKQLPDPIDLSGSENSPTIPTLTNARPPTPASASVSLTPGHSIQLPHFGKPLPGIKISAGDT